MPTGRYICQVRLERDGALPEDDVVNVYHFESDDPDQTLADWDDQAPGLVDRVAAYYEAIGTFFAQTLTGNGTITLYNHREPQQRVPRFVTPFTFNPGTGALPAEVALCLSMRATLDSGTFPARRRGRVYLGPFKPTGGVDGSDYRPDGTMCATILSSANTMAHGGSGAARLAVYSPRTDPDGQSNECYNDVVHLWIDNSWDTQRRRGAAATTRFTSEVTG